MRHLACTSFEGLIPLKSDEKSGVNVFKENQDSRGNVMNLPTDFHSLMKAPLSSNHLFLVVSAMRTPRWQLYTAFMQIG